MRTTSQGGSKYFITFIDDYSRFIEVKFLKQKSDAFGAFKEFATRVENQTGNRIKCLRSDNGREYLSNDFLNYLKNKGIVHETTVAYTPEQNGVAERANRTLVEMARCMLVSANLSESLWAEAVNTAAYIRNRCPTRILKHKTPYECLRGCKPSVKHFKEFGCEAVVLDKHPGKSKFARKGSKVRFVGYANHTKGYRFYNMESKNIVIARDVIFFEDNLRKNSIEKEDINIIELELFGEREKKVIENNEIENKASIKDIEETNEQAQESAEESESSVEYEIVSGKRKRGRPRISRTGKVGRPKKIYVVDNPEVLNLACENPASVKEALQSSESSQWRCAMQAEYDSLLKSGAWTLTDRPHGKNVIGCRWVFTKKYDANGKLEKYKARLVAQGCSQKFGEDYFLTFAPVVKHSTIRLILALAVQHKLLVHHIDVVAAYLNGELEEELYMRQPEGFVDENQLNKVCRLQKSLYGLKQAGRYWNNKLNKVLYDIGFTRCKADNCVYIMCEKGEINLLSVYVDDIILACSSEITMKKIIKMLNAEVEAIDRGPIRYYLGMEVERDGPRGNISIHQGRYVHELLRRWNMADCKGAATPYSNGTVLEKCNDSKCSGYLKEQYMSLVGGLTYLAIISRPDIAHTVSKLAQFNSHPHKEHFVAAKRVLRYLKQNPKGIITYKANHKSLICFSDADWASDSTDRKSVSGYALFLGDGLIAWESKKQHVVSLSTMEAEYIAMCNAAKDISFHRSLLSEMGFRQYIEKSSKMLCDNQSAQFAVKNPVVHKRSKHIDIKFHYIREKYLSCEIDIEYIPSAENAADIFTKTLCKEKHNTLCKLLKMKFL